MPAERYTRRGTLAVTWGPSGGWYLHHHRVCLGRLAITYVPGIEIDDLMRGYVFGMPDEATDDMCKAAYREWTSRQPGEPWAGGGDAWWYWRRTIAAALASAPTPGRKGGLS